MRIYLTKTQNVKWKGTQKIKMLTSYFLFNAETFHHKNRT